MTDPQVRRTSEMYIATPIYRVEDVPRFPDVPIKPGVDLEGLMAAYHDPGPPVFVTRPLAILNEVSENGIPYNEAVFDDIYQQVLTKPFVARRGHIAEADRGSAFPPDDGYWVGVVVDTTTYDKPTLFGKCYLVPGKMREMVLGRHATGTPLSNSMWGGILWVDNTPVGVEVESIDFVPQERASLKALGGEFVVTSEMKEDPMPDKNDAAEKKSLKEMLAETQPEDLHEALRESGSAHRMAEMHFKTGECKECSTATMSEMVGDHRRGIAETFLKEQVTPENTYEMLSPAQRKACAEAYCKETSQKMTAQEEAKVQETAIAEMKTQLADVPVLKTRLAEMETVIRVYQRKEFESELAKAVDVKFAGFAEMHTTTGQSGLAELKEQLTFRAMAEMAGMKGGHTLDNIPTGVDVAYPKMKSLIEMFASSAGGPPVITGASRSPQQGSRLGVDPATGHFTPEFMQQARDAAAGAQRRRTPGGK